jgi:hypothetical protein
VRFATTLERFEAAVVDGVNLWIGMFAVALLFALVAEEMSFVVAFLWLCGFVLSEIYTGSAFGRNVMGLVVCRSNGLPAGRLLLGIRALLKRPWLWPLLMLAYGPLAADAWGLAVPSAFAISMQAAALAGIGYSLLDAGACLYGPVTLTDWITRTRVVQDAEI